MPSPRQPFAKTGGGQNWRPQPHTVTNGYTSHGTAPASGSQDVRAMGGISIQTPTIQKFQPFSFPSKGKLSTGPKFTASQPQRRAPVLQASFGFEDEIDEDDDEDGFEYCGGTTTAATVPNQLTIEEDWVDAPPIPTKILPPMETESSGKKHKI